jgi:uncharacterized repeat protein (TIGR03803 family)
MLWGRNVRHLGQLRACKKICAAFLLCTSFLLCTAFLLCTMAATVVSAQTTFTSLFSFAGTNGADPHYVYLVQGIDGKLYGTTYASTGSGGTAFKITTAGSLTTLYTFCVNGIPCMDGAQPTAGLVLASNGNFYGTTTNGGANNDGTVFAITPAGKLTTLHSFDSTDGAEPEVGLIQATNGALYGTTSIGGSSDVGTIFEITTAGKLTSLLSFNGTNGDYPDARLVQGTNGNFYGTTYEVSSGSGTVFDITSAGKLSTLHKFDGTDGGGPTGVLIQATNGNFYGTTTGDGANSSGGTVFQITPAGKLTTLYSFCSKSGCTDGSSPQGGLVQDTNGTFYGTTYYGGTDGIGTIFSLSLGLAPFVETVPSSGKVGATVIILGTNLTGATKVSFDGTAATFTVASSTEIKTTVPTGATTGSITVVTPSGTLTSNVAFRVSP